jgi:ferrous iron transport protein B
MTHAAPLIALVGNPNAGKSALFNALTGARQKTGNYPGVTVERHVGKIILPDGRPAELVDLPGTYSLEPASPDEQVTHDVLFGTQAGERKPDALIVVLDAGNLEIHLRFALELIALRLPTVIALNMVDMAARDGLVIDAAKLSAALGVPVIETVAVRRKGTDDLKAALEATNSASSLTIQEEFSARTSQARAIAKLAIVSESVGHAAGRSLDKIALHPVIGPVLLALLLFTMFQAVFAWATPFADAIDGGFGALQGWVKDVMPDTILRSLITDGVIAGVGAVIVFLPQIVILFSFILILEQTGYMARAALLMDRLMASVGLSGRAFIPLLSSFACAVPGIMATRTIEDPRDRLTTILIAPLMTCSARLPVYTVIIGAFIPARNVLPGIGLQGLVMFALYLAGILGALIAAFVVRRSFVKGQSMGFIMELPRYQMPHLRDLLFALWQKAWSFLKRAGTIIALTTIILWALLSFPRVDPMSGVSQIDHSIAGRIANAVTPVVEPIGFNRDIALALIPAMSAREVAVSALATTYAIDDSDEAQRDAALGDRLAGKWSLATALAFLAWFVFAPQCISTIAVVRRETNSWRWTLFMVGYLFALAYAAAGATYWVARSFGL